MSFESNGWMALSIWRCTVSIPQSGFSVGGRKMFEGYGSDDFVGHRRGGLLCI